MPTHSAHAGARSNVRSQARSHALLNYEAFGVGSEMSAVVYAAASVAADATPVADLTAFLRRKSPLFTSPNKNKRRR